MNSDIPIPVMTKAHSGWQVPHVLPVIGKHLRVYDESHWHLAPQDAMVLCHPQNLHDDDVQQLAQDGRKVVVDNIWDGHSTILEPPFPILELRIDCFFWVHEYCWHREQKLDDITIAPTYERLAFMPMRHSRYFRQVVLERFDQLLPDMIWSYEDQALPNDHPERYDRYFCQEWYDKTSQSVVVETVVDTVLPFPFLTEKTFKPIIFGHPFQVIGCRGSLEWLQANGFETFNDVFDESYDHMPDWRDRVDRIYHNVIRQGHTAWDDETKQRIAHNRAVFFDTQRVQDMAERRIIAPIREWYET